MNQIDNIHIRPVDENDAEFLTSLMNHPFILKSLNETPTELSDWADAMKEWSCDDDEEDFIVMNGNTPIGWLGINGLLNEDGTAYLKMAVLLPDFQSRGLGTAALQKLVFILRQKGIYKLALYTDQDNQIAQACYKKCGFKIVDSLTETMSNGRVVPRYKMETIL